MTQLRQRLQVAPSVVAGTRRPAGRARPSRLLQRPGSSRRRPTSPAAARQTWPNACRSTRHGSRALRMPRALRAISRARLATRTTRSSGTSRCSPRSAGGPTSSTTRSCAAMCTSPSVRIADRHATGSGALLYRQIARCARAHLIGSQVEQDQPQTRRCATQMILRASIPSDAAAQSVEDWPLLEALREIRLEPGSRNAIAQLATRATAPAGAAAAANQPERASRLLAAVAQGLLALGDTDKARRWRCSR